MSVEYRCPKCGKSISLWEGVDVPGWRSVEVMDGKLVPGHDRDVEWSNAETNGDYGCGECGWEGRRAQIEVKLGIDGKPLPEVIPGQESFE